MTYRHYLKAGFVGLAVLLAGCAEKTAPTATAPAARDTVVETADADLLNRVGTLPPQTLQDGTCGLFLWARTRNRNLVLFATDQAAKARIMIDGQQIEIPRVRTDGDLIFGHYTRETFAGHGLTLRVTIDPDEEAGIIGGTVVRRGTLNMSDGDGWNSVLPVAGMIACKGR